MNEHLLPSYLSRIEVCANPVFVIGSFRSGTTAVARALDQHSQLWASEESHILYWLLGQGRIENEYRNAANLLPMGWLEAKDVTQSEFLAYVGLGLNGLFTSRSGGKRWIDHTPYYGLMVDTLTDMFPGAYFLHILRDGRAVVRSMLRMGNAFSEWENAERQAKGLEPPWSKDFRVACATWRQLVEAGMDASRQYPSRCMTAVNEDLVRDPEGGFARILEFIGVPYEDSPIDFFRSNRINSSFPLEDVKRPPATDAGLAAWQEWTLEQRQWFIMEAAPTLIKYGLAAEEELTLDEGAGQSGPSDSGGSPSGIDLTGCSPINQDPTQRDDGLEPGHRYEEARKLLENLPKLHCWDGEWTVGGLNESMGNLILSETSTIQQTAPLSVIETGAGATTLLFLCLQPQTLISIAPDAELRDRILRESEARGYNSSPLSYMVDRSEIALPRLAEECRRFNVALIDGDHGWPCAFVDFCYMNRMLQRNGILIIDDTQLYSIQQLYSFLLHQPEYELVGVESKLAIFRKVTDKEFLPDWGGQPFVIRNTSKKYLPDWASRTNPDATTALATTIATPEDEPIVDASAEMTVVVGAATTPAITPASLASPLLPAAEEPILERQVSQPPKLMALDQIVQKLLVERDSQYFDAIIDALRGHVNAAESQQRRMRARKQPDIIPAIHSYDQRECLRRCVLEADAPWSDLSVLESGIPSMITEEEKKYYVYIGRFYAGVGKAVELGPWLGCSTFYIHQGLISNPRFASQPLYVFDDFVWRSSWMDEPYLRLGGSADEKPADGRTFRPLFDEFTEKIAVNLTVQERRIVMANENKHIPPLSWNEGPIETCYIDCGRTFDVNSTWYQMLSPYFIPNRTLLILQDWQQHKEVPAKWYNQIKEFTDSRGTELDLIHELSRGGVGTFLYRGN